MKQATLCIIIALTVLLPSAAMAKLPTTVANITLGDTIDKYSDLILPDTAMGNRDALFVDEVNINPEAIPGIRGGSITTGNCNAPGKIIGVKLKFVDRSKDLYDALEKQYRRSFGNPDEWLGDAFHNIVSWKWNLHEGDEDLEIVLTYSKDSEFRPGVSIKMILRSAWNLEMEKYSAKQKSHKKHKMMHGDYSKEKLTNFIPR